MKEEWYEDYGVSVTKHNTDHILYMGSEAKKQFDSAIQNYLNNSSELSIKQNTKIEINNKMSDKLYVKESDVPKTNTRIAFIRKFIESKAASYNDDKFTDLQCEKGRYRSITELHQIVLSRFPKTSFEAIIRIVKDLINDAKPVCMCYCTTINKVVLMYTDNSTRQYTTNNSVKNYLDREGKDGYTLNDYMTMIDKLNK